MTPAILAYAAAAALALLLGGCASTPLAANSAGPAAIGTAVAPPLLRQIVVTVRNTGPAAPRAVGTTGPLYGGLGRYQATPAARRDAAAIARRHGLRPVAAWPIEVLDLHCIVYAVDDGRALDVVLAAVRADRRVESAQPLQQFRSLTATQSTADPYAALQDGFASLQVGEAHRWTRGAGVRVAVIDSGIDDAHPDLAGRVVLTRDFTGQPAGSARRDLHGTAVAGVIAANADNGEGIVGVAPQASLLSLRACWQSDGGATVCNTLTLAQALAQTFSDRADVLNLSLTGPADPLLERLLRRALAMGKIVVAAVPDRPAPHEGFPATLPGVLAVTSSDATAVVDAAGVEVLGAPGHNVLTLRPGGRYDFDHGSSLAAAHVSGVVALLRALRGDLDAAQARALLRPRARSTAAAAPAGAPPINACRAVITLRGSGDCTTIRRMRAARQ